MTWPWAVTHQQLRSGQLRSREVHAGPLGRDRKGSIGKPRGTETFCPKLTGAAHRTSCFAATSHFPSAAAPRGALAGALSPGRSGGPGGRALATGQQQGCGQGLCAQLPPRAVAVSLSSPHASNSCYGGRLPDTPTMKRQLPTSPRECWKESGFISRPGHERTWVFRTGVVAR